MNIRCFDFNVTIVINMIHTLKKILRNNSFITTVIFSVLKTYQRLIQLLCGVRNNQIVFMSFRGKQYSDNTRAISEKLHELDSTFNIIWVFDNPSLKMNHIPAYVTPIKIFSLAYYYYLATSKFWVDNNRKNGHVYKSKKQVYILTWHGDRAMKKIGYDQPANFSRKVDRILENEICDYIVTGSKFSESMYKTAFAYNGKYLAVGSPRNDRLMNPNLTEIKKIKQSLQVQDSHILLYAPTFRKEYDHNHKKQPIEHIDLVQVVNSLEQITKKKWICFIRSHNYVKGLQLEAKDPRIIDYSDYDDMADLLLIADLLITDYSSCATDFILTNKPVILFQADYETYLSHEREFYYNIETTGFAIAKSQAELIEMLPNLDEIALLNETIKGFYDTYETGRAATLVAENIISLK